MTTVLAMALEALTPAPEAVARAREEAKRLLVPSRGPVPASVVRAYLARALRNGAWPRLRPEQRALLIAVPRTVSLARSPTLVEALREVFLEIELATARGRAVLAALLALLSRGARALAHALRRGLDYLIALGLQLLNHPLLSGAALR